MIPREQLADFVAALRETLVTQASMKSGEGPEIVTRRREQIESTLANMDVLKFDRGMSDEAFWRIAASKPFYAGHLAGAVDSRERHMFESYLGDRRALCSSEWDVGGARYRQFLSDEKCYRNEPDLKMVIGAARTIERLKKFKPKRTIIDHFFRQLPDWTSITSLQAIHQRMLGDLRFGPVTTFHLMTELGLPVIKPDRVVNRAAVRMGLIDSYTVGNVTHSLTPTISTAQATQLGQKPEFNWALQDVFRRISDETGVSMRSLDFIVVKLGQEPDEVNGFARMICADSQPLCHVCGVRSSCAFAKRAS